MYTFSYLNSVRLKEPEHYKFMNKLLVALRLCVFIIVSNQIQNFPNI